MPGYVLGALDGAGNLNTIASTPPGACSTVTTESSSSTRAASTSATGSVTSAGQTAAATSLAATCPSQSHARTVVGLGVGIPLGLTTVLAAGVALLFASMLRKERRKHTTVDEKATHTPIGQTRSINNPTPVEMDSGVQRPELHSQARNPELDGRKPEQELGVGTLVR